MAPTSFFRRVVSVGAPPVDLEKATESTPLLLPAGRATVAAEDEPRHSDTTVGGELCSEDDEIYRPCRLSASNGDYTIAAVIIGSIMIAAHYPWIGWASDLFKRNYTLWGGAVIFGWVFSASTVIFYVTIATLDQVAFDVAWYRARPTDDEGPCHTLFASRSSR